MKKYRVQHQVNCFACGEDMTQADVVEIHFSAAEEEFDRLSCVDEKGFLVDVDRLVENGYHACSRCSFCNEQLEELEDD